MEDFVKGAGSVICSPRFKHLLALRTSLLKKRTEKELIKEAGT